MVEFEQFCERLQVQSRASDLQAFADQCKHEIAILKAAAATMPASATQSPHIASSASAGSNIPPSPLHSNPPRDSVIAAVAQPAAFISSISSSASAAAPRIASHPPSTNPPPPVRAPNAPTAGGRVLPASLLADFADDDDDDDDGNAEGSNGGQ